ncbi:polysaccharide deacetylase family protein [Streptomyces vinaceus]|uniref:polysaccharide deacetylase family protein n=1 Tax=Streptomyces vinaceus TaxID=1960 RepID=UPI0038039621
MSARDGGAAARPEPARRSWAESAFTFALGEAYRSATKEQMPRRARDSFGDGAAEAYAVVFTTPAHEGRLGAAHCLDLPFVFDKFDSWSRAPFLAGTDARIGDGLARTVRAAWIAFIRTGDPNHPAVPRSTGTHGSRAARCGPAPSPGPCRTSRRTGTRSSRRKAAGGGGGLKGGARRADGSAMETRSFAPVRAAAYRPLLRVFAALFALVWAVAPGPSAAAMVAEDGLRSLFASENRVIRTPERVVAVTFNAAWNDAGLAPVLDELARRPAPATFFLTGDFADRHPEVVRRIATAGHGLGNHSYSHPYFKDLTAAGRREEVRAADRALRTAGAGAALTPYFRFPYSETSPEHITEVNGLGYADIEFTTDTNGWMGTEGGMTVDRAVGRALDALRPGAIIQMHVGAPEGRTEVLDAQALPRILEAISTRGYRVIDLRTLLTTPPAAPSTR